MATFVMPFNTVVRVSHHGSAHITSELRSRVGKPAADALESFLLAMAAEGIKLDNPRITRALDTAAEAISNWSD